MDHSQGKFKSDDAGRLGVVPPSPGIKEASHIIAAMNLIRMNLGMYPPGHVRISESVDSAHDLIKKVLRGKTEWVIRVAGNTLIFGETVLDKKNSAFRDYATCLSNLRIIAIILHRNVKKDELVSFNRLLSYKPMDIWARGKLEDVMAREGITGIAVKVIDMDDFHLTEESEIVKDKSDANTSNEDFWQDFISRLTSGTEKSGTDGDIPSGHEKLDPAEAVRFLNERRENWQAAVECYEQMVQEYFYELRKGRQISADQYEALARVSDLIKDLHPELKEQFLDVVERQLSLQPEAALIMENLRCFPQDMLLEMIRLANERKSQISPALVNLLKKMTGIAEEHTEADPSKDINFTSREMENLLKREEHEKYVPEDYNRLLKKAAEAPPIAEKNDDSRFSIQDQLETLTDEHVDFRICQFVFTLMDDDIAEEEYQMYASRLYRSLQDLLKAGHFSFLTSVIETLHRHSHDKTSEGIRQKALSTLIPLADKETMARCVTPFIIKGTVETRIMANFLLASGVQNIPWLFDIYLDAATPPSAALIEIMKGFGRNATEEAMKRFSSKGSQTLIRLLMFIRETDDRSVAPYLKNLYRHEDWTVKKEVLATLIQFDDPSIIELLRSSLSSPHREDVFQAVNLSCRYRVRDLLPDLTSMIKTFMIRDESAILNEWIVSELGKTGHPSVIPHFEKIAAIRFTLSPKHLTRMKVIVYEHLERFPRDQVMDLLKRGKRSFNRDIKKISSKILGDEAS